MNRLALLLLLATAACGPSEASKPTPAAERLTFSTLDRVQVRDGRGVFTADRDGRITTIAFDVPTVDVDPTVTHIGDRLGETADGVVVFLDQYASRPRGNRCAQGIEAFVRVFSLAERRQLLAVPASSCLRGINAPTPPATWLGEGRFRIEHSGDVYMINNGAVSKQG